MSTTETKETKAAPALSNTKTVQLDEPIKRGDKLIEEVTVRKPNVGALRDVSLTELMSLNVSAIQKVLPRCTEPALVKQDIEALDTADLVQLGTAVVGFLLTKKMRTEFQDA